MSEKFLKHLSEACTELIQTLPQRPTAFDSATWRKKFDADLEAAKVKNQPKKKVSEMTNEELLERYEQRLYVKKMQSCNF